jgi:hypothetical protein
MNSRLTIRVALATLATLVVRPLHAQAPAELEIEVEAAPPSTAPVPGNALEAAPPAAPAVTPEELSAVRSDLARLEQRLLDAEAESASLRQANEALRRESEQRARDVEASSLRERVAKRGVRLSGYIQAQYGQNQLSEDQLLPGGTPLNQDRFAIRRGRLRLTGRWRYARADFELDASTTRGPVAGVRRAAVGVQLPNDEAPDALPYLTLQLGLTEIPFGLELQQGQDDILFLERTTGSLALFPGPVDTGVKLDAVYGPFRAQLAIMNGVPLDDRAGGPNGIDPTRRPDYLGRLGFDTRPLEALHIAGGASFLTGRGFHAGSDATKPVLQWDDSNGDGVINAGELVAVAGRGAIPSETFARWALGVDLGFEVQSKIGWTRLYGELVLATNLDRGLYVADPILRGDDLRELNWYAALVQDITRWAFVGVRYEVYDPNSDLVDNRRGRSIPADASIATISPVVGARLPGYGRLTFQYDAVQDKLARDVRGVPADVENNQWTLRAQGEF